ncbi:MAG: gamma-glutamyl-gamma-aminobutyrate hydrolase family protein [Nitrospirae bacterium]|nr:gamma-glutamyl-gamma-aminobutyrate hydrolase family protein [Nitrospirota bacterium]
MPRPRVAVMGDFNPGNMERFGGDEAHHFLNARYTRAVADAGGLPWLLPVPDDAGLANAYLDQVDGVVLTGCGRHLDPAAYGERPRFDLNIMAPAKQAAEFALIRAALARGMPVLAICGGMQSLNVVLGGTLVQRIADEVEQPLAHMQTSKATHTVHDVAVTPGSRLAAVTGRTALATNSSHTQAVDRLGEGLAVCARAADGVVEAIEGRAAQWLLAVQWHPEYLYRDDPAQSALFQRFVAACRA